MWWGLHLRPAPRGSGTALTGALFFALFAGLAAVSAVIVFGIVMLVRAI